MTKDEKLLLSVVSDCINDDYSKYIIDNKNAFIIEQLSHVRGNLIEWLPLSDKKVLEINGCYGALSDLLAHKSQTLTVQVFNEGQYKICNKRLDNNPDVKLVFNDDTNSLRGKGQYDYVIVGNPYYESVSHLVHEINNYKSIIASHGVICIAIDNKYGLKYFTGAKEPNTGKRFKGIEGYVDYKGARCFSLQEINKALDEVGDIEVKWYYPYPDRVFPDSIYSDDYLPKKGQLDDNVISFDGPDMVLFDATCTWNNLIEDGLFKQFANSYLLLIEVNQ